MCCNPAALKKLGKTPKKVLFWAQFAHKYIIMGHTKKTLFGEQITKQIIGFQKPFILSKYDMFWLSYESRSDRRFLDAMSVVALFSLKLNYIQDAMQSPQYSLFSVDCSSSSLYLTYLCCSHCKKAVNLPWVMGGC